MDGLTKGWMDGRINRCMDGFIEISFNFAVKFLWGVFNSIQIHTKFRSEF